MDLTKNNVDIWTPHYHSNNYALATYKKLVSQASKYKDDVNNGKVPEMYLTHTTEQLKSIWGENTSQAERTMQQVLNEFTCLWLPKATEVTAHVFEENHDWLLHFSMEKGAYGEVMVVHLNDFLLQKMEVKAQLKNLKEQEEGMKELYPFASECIYGYLNPTNRFSDDDIRKAYAYIKTVAKPSLSSRFLISTYLRTHEDFLASKQLSEVMSRTWKNGTSMATVQSALYKNKRKVQILKEIEDNYNTIIPELAKEYKALTDYYNNADKHHTFLGYPVEVEMDHATSHIKTRGKFNFNDLHQY